ncbi:MAG: PilZ domain-containing protein [Mariprofundaceae bacterium]|nr:PilZ domain-containing protein [Mariprofundaceae bacterium]
MPELSLNKHDDNRRQDFRIDDMIPMSDRPLTKDEYESKKNQVGIRSRQSSMLQEMVGRDVFSADLKDVINSDVARAMESLDAKLNYLIGVNMLNDANSSDLKERAVNLSVTGASFYSSERYKLGDAIKTCLMLPSFPPITLDLIGEVVWVSGEKKGKMHIGVRFFYRCDEEEDSIAKYVFRRHRESLRLRVKNADR